MQPLRPVDPAVIELDDVSVAFGEHRILEGLTLRIPRNETTVIVGRSGSGKTVLLKLMMGLMKPNHGHVRLFGRDLAEISQIELVELHRRMGMLFQNYALLDALSVEDNIEFPLREAARVPRHDAEQVSHELIGMLGLTGSERVLPGDLSGGMRKRTGLARALAARPEVILLDEPTTGLDPLMVEQVDEIISSAKQRYAMTVVMVSHDLASIRRVADRVAFLHEGKILFWGRLDEFLGSELAPIREFLGTTSSGHAAAATQQADRPVVELIDIHKSFGDKHVLEGVDLAIYPRRITALIGGSGSGKSVMARHILGLVKPDSGRVLLFGKDIAAMRLHELEAVRRRFGLVFQHSALLDWLDVEDNVAFPLVERREAKSVIRERVDELLERLELAQLRHRMPGDLSSGERKRVAVARTLAMRPDILIYDEPTTGQDPLHAREIEDLIVQAQQKFDITTIMISHDMPATFRVAHTIAMLHDGKIVACGPPAQLAASTDAYVRHFLSASAVV